MGLLPLGKTIIFSLSLNEHKWWISLNPAMISDPLRQHFHTLNLYRKDGNPLWSRSLVLLRDTGEKRQGSPNF